MAPIVGLVTRTSRWSERTRCVLLVAGLGAAASTLGGFVAATSRSNAEDLYREGVELFSADRLRESIPFFVEMQRLSPLSASAYHARYFEAMVYFREKEWREAETRFARMAEDFPEAPNAPEALYHLGLARERLGDAAGAERAWREAADRFPDAHWGRLAAERLMEIGAQRR
jgi:TolA-binding protein